MPSREPQACPGPCEAEELNKAKHTVLPLGQAMPAMSTDKNSLREPLEKDLEPQIKERLSNYTQIAFTFPDLATIITAEFSKIQQCWIIGWSIKGPLIEITDQEISSDKENVEHTFGRTGCPSPRLSLSSFFGGHTAAH